MPYQVVWIVPQRVILTTFTGVVSAAELQGFVVEIVTKLRDGQPPIYHISNSLAMGKVELSFKAVLELVKSVSQFHGLKVQIDVNHPRAFNTFMASAASQLTRLEAHTVPTLAEAIALLKRIDTSLETANWEMPAVEPALLAGVAEDVAPNPSQGATSNTPNGDLRSAR